MSSYKMKIAGLDRELKMFAVNDKLDIAALFFSATLRLRLRRRPNCLKKRLNLT